jgi:hypothetical protein
MSYNYTTLLDQWEDLPTVKVRYTDDETGWAKQLAPDCVCIANLPWADDLFLYDICTLDRPTDPEEWPQVGEVLQQYYRQRALVRCEDAETQAGALLAHYRAFCAEMRARDCAVEGSVSGAAQVQGPGDCDLAAQVQAAAQVAGLTVTRVEVTARDEDDDEPPGAS